MRKIPQLDVNPSSNGRLGARGWETDGLMVLQLEGVAEIPDKPQLSELLKRVHAEAMLRSIKTVVVELSRLTFMNSSCFKDFVSWISLVQELKEGYKVRFRTNPSIRWQKGSLHTLKSFGIDIVSFE